METTKPQNDKKERSPDDHVQLSLPFMKDYPPVKQPPVDEGQQGEQMNGNPD